MCYISLPSPLSLSLLPPLSRMIQRCPLVFLTSPIANTTIQCGMAASQHMHRDALASVMKYFKDLIHLPYDNYFVSMYNCE